VYNSVLITGSSGFLGSHLKNTLISRNYEVHELSGDIRGICDFNKSVDVVFHLAAKTKGSEFKNNLSNSFDINISGTQAVLNYCARNNTTCIFISTCGVYKPTANNTYAKEDSLIQPVSSYAISKFIAENLCKQFFASFGFPITILRMFNIYGEGQKEPYLVPYIINRLVKGEIIELRMPNALRDFIYVEDAVGAIITAGMNKSRQLNIYNIGSGKNVRVIDFIRTTEIIFQKTANIEMIGNKYDEVHSMIADNRKVIKELKFKINTELTDGIQKIKQCMTQIIKTTNN
jgi:nucleoside-diphosphate-sugar epimerase